MYMYIQWIEMCSSAFCMFIQAGIENRVEYAPRMMLYEHLKLIVCDK